MPIGRGLRGRFLDMKIHFLAIVFGFAATLSTPAAFEHWTNKDGRKAELEFIGKAEKDGEPAAEFRLRGGQKAVIKVSDLDEASQAKLETLLAAAPAAGAGAAGGAKSVFDDTLQNKLVKLDGGSVNKADAVAKPTKYYVFYYSASWCPPCQRFTPLLVDFYNKKKPKNTSFELVFVSSDRDEQSMEGYMKEKKMPWPALKFSAIQDFRGNFQHPVDGIPLVVVCDLEGKIVGNTRDIGELENLLKD